jgi:hypothetical protein
MHSYSYTQTSNQKKVVFSILLTSFWIFGGLIMSFIIFGPESNLGLTILVINAILSIATLIYYTRKYVLEKVEITLKEDQFTVYFSHLNETITLRKSDVIKIKHGDYQISTIGKHYLWIWMKNPRYNLFIENHKDQNNEAYVNFVEAFIGFLK